MGTQGKCFNDGMIQSLNDGIKFTTGGTEAQGLLNKSNTTL